MRTYSVYILRCADSSYYTGITSNLEGRYFFHQQGKISGYTRRRRPVTLVYYEEFQDVFTAIAREKQIKGWTRDKKTALIESDEKKLIQLSHRHPSAGSG